MATLTAYTATPARARASSRAATWDDAILAGYVVLLAWAPFWFGGNSAFAWGVNAVAFPALVVLYELGLMLRRAPHPVGLRRIWAPALAIALCALWIVMQMASWTPAALHHPIWAMAAEVLGRPLDGSITLSCDLTALALMRLATAACAFWLALQLGRDPRRARRMLAAVALIGAAYAAYGILAFFAMPDTILWYDKLAYRDTLTATFVNRNSFATYAGCAMIACFVLFLGALQRGADGEPWGIKAARLAVILVGPGGLALVGGAIIATALLLTGSRAGISATFLALAATGLLFAIRSRSAGSSGLWLPALAFGLLCVLVMAAGEVFVSRLEKAGAESGGRLAVFGLTWDSIVNAPLLGSGYGTFERAFPMYRDSSVPLRYTWDKAHNTHLEVLQGLGLVGGALLFAAMGWIVLRCFKGVLGRRQLALAPLAAFGASVLVTLHAFVDFSLQIQAVAVTWTALLGIGLAQSWSTQDEISDAPASAARAHPSRKSMPSAAGRSRRVTPVGSR